MTQNILENPLFLTKSRLKAESREIIEDSALPNKEPVLNYKCELGNKCKKINVSNKSCRPEAEYGEKRIVAKIKETLGKTIPQELLEDRTQRTKNTNLEPAILLASTVLLENFDISDAEWIGSDDYGTRGDIRLILTSRDDEHIEIKTPTGSFVTLANLGQGILPALTTKEEKTQNWNNFEKENGFLKKRWDAVSNGLGRSSFTSARAFITACRELRDKRNAGDKEAERILASLHELAEDGKREYLKYLYPRINREILSKVLMLLVQGHHKAAEIRRRLKSSKKIVEGEGYKILTILNCENENDITYTLEDAGSYRTSEVIDMKIVPSGLAIQATLGNGDQFELRLHYKNVAQGVSTPCVMVFRS